MIIGPTVDEAAEYYRLPEWSGVSTCPSISKILTDAQQQNEMAQLDMDKVVAVVPDWWIIGISTSNAVATVFTVLTFAMTRRWFKCQGAP
jgi:hypothetical protein